MGISIYKTRKGISYRPCHDGKIISMHGSDASYRVGYELTDSLLNHSHIRS